MKKVGLLILALVVALGALGAGYAAWSESITVTGTVSAGNLDVDFAVASNDAGNAQDPREGGSWDGISWTEGIRWDYDAASTDVTLNPTSDENADAVTSNTLTITVTDVYPGYKSSVALAVTNNGTIPVKVSTGTITDTTPAGVRITGDITAFADVIQPGATVYCYGYLECTDALAEKVDGSATVTFTFEQFNK
jgi:hypothetical protein